MWKFKYKEKAEGEADQEAFNYSKEETKANFKIIASKSFPIKKATENVESLGSDSLSPIQQLDGEYPETDSEYNHKLAEDVSRTSIGVNNGDEVKLVNKILISCVVKEKIHKDSV